MNDLSKAERFKKCLNCGSEEHRAADCKATRRKNLAQQEPKSKPQVAQVSQPAPSTSQSQPIAQATPIMSMDSFLQQASQALRQLEAAQAAQGVSSGATAPATSTLPVNPTPEGGGQQQPPSSQPSIKRLAITSIMPASCFQASHLESQTQGDANPPSEAGKGGLPGPDLEAPLAYALLDSGATHPMRQARDEHEWDAACEVQVALAGDNTTSMRLTPQVRCYYLPGGMVWFSQSSPWVPS